MSTHRAQREVEHGRKLAASSPEVIWGWDTPSGRRRAQRRAELIATAADLHPGKTVLEVGCGTGVFTELLSATGASILAVDISPELIELARRKNFPGTHVSFHVGSFEECGIKGPFDAVAGSSVLHHLELEKSLQQIYAMLKPGGIMCFAEPNMLNPQIMVERCVPGMRHVMGNSPDETAFVRWNLARCIRRMGFVHVVVTPYDFLHPLTPKLFLGMVDTIGRCVEHIPVLKEIAGSLIICAQRPV